MSDTPQRGRWLASDGHWYPPEPTSATEPTQPQPTATAPATAPAPAIPGSGWWQASDGHWYPPEQSPGAGTTNAGPPPHDQAPGATSGKPIWPWIAGGVGLLLLVVLVIGIAVGSAVNSTDDADPMAASESSSSTAPTTAPTTAPPTTLPTTTSPPTTTAPETTTAPPTPTPPTPTPSQPAAPAAPSLMPDVVCMNLQDAQDRIQAEAGVFLSRSFDATGQERNQIVDSNWLVVSQIPAPGAQIGEGDANLGAVKYGEQNPC